MKFLGTFRTNLILLAIANIGCAQTPSVPVAPVPAQPSTQEPGPTIRVELPLPIKRIGKASVYYDEKAKRSRATVMFYALGRAEDIQKVDVLSIETQVEGPGKEPMKPESVDFRLNSYSHGVAFKYKNDSKLSIFINGTLFLSGTCRPSFANIDPRGGVEGEYFSPRLSYEQFSKLLSGKDLSMKFGGTEFEIKGENLDALKDLARSVSPGH